MARKKVIEEEIVELEEDFDEDYDDFEDDLMDAPITNIDDKGFIRKQTFIGIDGNVEYSALQGGAMIAYECNEYGFFNKITFMDADGNPCATNQGNAIIKLVTDEKGNELERWNCNVNNELVANEEGYAGQKAEYD